MLKARTLMFSLVSGLLGMSLVGASLMEITGSSLLPFGQYFLGANVPMAALVLGVGFLAAAVEPGLRVAFTRLAVVYAIASIAYQLTATQMTHHVFAQALIVPIVAAVLMVIFHPNPRLLVPTTSTTLREGSTSRPVLG